MSTRLFENEASAGWVLTAALHLLAVGLVFWLVLALVRRQGPTEGCWFGRAGTVALLLLPLTLLTTGLLNRKSPPLSVAISRPSPAVAVDAAPSATRLVLPVQTDFAAANPASAPRDYRSIAAHSFGGVWLLGALVLLLRMCHGAEKMRRLRKRLRAPHPDADSKLLALLERLGIAPSTVRVADADVVPFATGLVSPLIVVPANLCAVLKPHEARMIVRHEQAHLRNGDLAWALAQGIARMLHWWNPFARSVLRQTELASEGLCDRAALSGERGRNGKAYAHCLVDLAERTSRRRLPACALSVTGDFRRLKRRLLWIADFRASPGAGTRALKLLAPALVAASALGLTALNAGAELPAKKEALATTRLDSGNEAVTKVGNVHIHAEQTSYHGAEGRIRFEDVKIVTPFYECRAKTAEYQWNKDHPKDLNKASLRLGGGVWAKIGEILALSEKAEIHPGDYTITFSGFPRVSDDRQIAYASAAETTAEFRFDRERGLSYSSIQGPNVAKIVKPDPLRLTPRKVSGTPPSPKENTGEQKKEGIMINADESTYENGMAVAKGNVRCTYNHDGISLEITGGHLTYEANTGNVVMREGAIVKLRGHEVFGEAATANIKLMIATVFGPGYLRKDGRKILLEVGAGVRIDAEGVHPISAPKEPRELLVPDVHGNLRSIPDIPPKSEDPGTNLPAPKKAGINSRSGGQIEVTPGSHRVLRHPSIPRGDFYLEGWERWREKRFNQPLYPTDGLLAPLAPE